MNDLLVLSPRQYTVWLWWQQRSMGEVCAAIERDAARLDRWLDTVARSALTFRIGRDLAALQREYDAGLRADVHELLEDVSPQVREALRAQLDRPGYLPATPLGMALVTSLGTAIVEDARSRKVPSQAAPSGLLARRALQVTGAVRVTDPGAPALGVSPSPGALQTLQRAVVGDAKTWKKWCNLLTLHAAWEKGQIACLRGALSALPEGAREEIGAWLDAPEWFATAGARAFRGSFVLESYAVEIVDRAIQRT